MGIAILKKIIDQSKDVIKSATSLMIYEKHHSSKKDSPSGTASNLKDQLSEFVNGEDLEIISHREGNSPGNISCNYLLRERCWRYLIKLQIDQFLL